MLCPLIKKCSGLFNNDSLIHSIQCENAVSNKKVWTCECKTIIGALMYSPWQSFPVKTADFLNERRLKLLLICYSFSVLGSEGDQWFYSCKILVASRLSKLMKEKGTHKIVFNILSDLWLLTIMKKEAYMPIEHLYLTCKILIMITHQVPRKAVIL